MDNDSSLDESSENFIEKSSDNEDYENGETQNSNEFEDDENTKETLTVECLTSAEVYKLMEDEISEVKEIIDLPKNETRILMNHFKWDKIQLLEKFYDEGKTKLFELAKIKQTSWCNDEPVTSIKSDQICEICYENDECIKNLPCKHSNFCRNCYEQYLTNQILNGISDDITCPGHKCDYILSDEIVLELLKSATMKSKYQYLITNQFVTHNRILKYCPQPLCGKIVKSEIVKTTVACECGFTFCFACSEELHEPVLCEIAERWEKLVQTDGGSKRWIYENTKPCPSCKSSIQKNGGCNHIICRHCNYHFCWICLKSSKSHYACDIDAKEPNLYSFNFEDYNLDFYTNVYESMKMSLKLEQQFLDLKDKTRSDWITNEFIREAAKVLYLNRRVLMFSYVFAFYIDANNQKSILEENLENLRAATEDLSGIIERDVTEQTIDVMERTVKDKIRYCDSRRKIMIDFVKDGYVNNYWKERLEGNNGYNKLYSLPCKSKK